MFLRNVVDFQPTTWCYIPEDNTLQMYISVDWITFILHKYCKKGILNILKSYILHLHSKVHLVLIILLHSQEF
jgi:hypothetical protein